MREYSGNPPLREGKEPRTQTPSYDALSVRDRVRSRSGEEREVRRERGRERREGKREKRREEREEERRGEKREERREERRNGRGDFYPCPPSSSTRGEARETGECVGKEGGVSDDKGALGRRGPSGVVRAIERCDCPNENRHALRARCICSSDPLPSAPDIFGRSMRS